LYGVANPCCVAKIKESTILIFVRDTASANGVIDVLDPADYGPLTITQGISIQGHGFGGSPNPLQAVP
jgi:hypothetical protein